MVKIPIHDVPVAPGSQPLAKGIVVDGLRDLEEKKKSSNFRF